jgi:hypothetical protein
MYIVFTLNPKFSGRYLYKHVELPAGVRETPDLHDELQKEILALCWRQYHYSFRVRIYSWHKG